MKISNASKKVLASALSAAMVVAFAPTVAFGAQDTQKINVQYDLAGGVDAKAGTQDATVASATYTVGADVASTYDEAGAKSYNAMLTGAVSTATVKTPATYKAAEGTAVAGVTYYKDNKGTALETQPSVGDDVSSYFVVDTPAANYTQDEADAYNAKLKGAVKAGDAKSFHTGAVVLQSGANVSLVSDDATTANTVEDYKFAGWAITYDKNGNGTIDAADGDFTDSTTVDGVLDVSDAKYFAGMTVTAKAVYDAPALGTVSATVDQADSDKKHAATLDVTFAVSNYAKAQNGVKATVTAPDGTKTVKNVTADDGYTVESVAAQVGEYTVEIVDGNGTALGKKSILVGSLELAGGAFDSIDGSGYKTTGHTYFYVADAAAGANYATVLNGLTSSYATVASADKKTFAGYTDVNGQLVSYDAKAGFSGDAVSAKGAVATTLTAYYGEASILSFAAKNGKLTVATAGASMVAKPASVTKPAEADESGYYLVVTDASGKIVAETVDTDANDNKTFAFAVDGSNYSVDVTEAGTYTASLYKVTAKSTAAATPGVEAGETAGKIELVATKTAAVSTVAAPTWSYAANYKADGTANGGILTLGNAAGDGYKVLFNGKDYDLTKGGQSYTTLPVSVTIQAVATDKKTDPYSSTVVTLTSCNQVVSDFDTFVAGFKTQTINGAATSYYSKDAGVVAATAAARKALTDAGFMVKNANDTEWDAAFVAAKQSVVDAVAAAAKAEAAVMYAGTTDAKGDLTKLTEESYNKVLAAISQVSADYAVNHDGDKTNNSKTAYATETAYITAIDAALTGAAKTTFKKADVEAAAAVNAMIAALPEADKATAADAEKAAAALAAYGSLTATQKQLVATADVAKIAAVQEAAAKAAAAEELKAAQDEAAIAKVKGKTVKAKAKKTTKSSLKVVTSKSGAKSTFKKVTKNSKVKVYKSGKIVVKKGLKAGKKYTVKVKATVGTQTKTVKVVVKVAK